MKKDKFEIFMYIFVVLFAVWYLFTIVNEPEHVMTVEECIHYEQLGL